MLHDFLSKKITEALPFQPTAQQADCIDRIAQFCTSPEAMSLFLLKGYAGTGKTSVVSALVKAMQALGQPTVLLAPTGRAAKVFASNAQQTALSIHKKIYRQKSITEFAFSLDINKHKDTLFIVDEASMIANNSSDGAFGSGRLLDDLITYVYSGNNCRIVLLGDSAQLLPVMQDYSPALDTRHLEGYGLTVSSVELTDVVRQSSDSGILFNATSIRQAIGTVDFSLPKFKLGFPDIRSIDGNELIDCLNASYNEEGEEGTIIITRSNKRANLYNQGIRNRVLMKEEMLSTGDLLIVTRNNYFWSRPYDNLDFIANGDIAAIKRIRGYHELYGFRFADVTLQLLDYDVEIDCRLIVDTLTAEAANAAEDISKRLFAAVEEDYAHIGNKRERYRQMREDAFLNALQVRFAYAITCHKAQGGQWPHVYVDSGVFKSEQINADLLPWLYTAVTRAQKRLFLVNFMPDFF